MTINLNDEVIEVGDTVRHDRWGELIIEQVDAESVWGTDRGGNRHRLLLVSLMLLEKGAPRE